MTPEDQLAREARLRPRQTVVAALAGLLLLLSAVLQISGPQAKVPELTVQLIVTTKRLALDVASSLLQAGGVLALAWTVAFLFDAARARRPTMSTLTRSALLAGGLISAVAGIVFTAILASRAHDFVHHRAQTYEQAHQLTRGAALPVLQTLTYASQFVLEIGVVLVALNAMRAGLLTRFMGYLGIAVGAAGMLLIGSPPSVALEIFWMLALAYLFAGRWQGGDPPAWRTGRAEPWPSSQEIRQQRASAAADGKAPAAAPAPEPTPVAASTGRPHPSSAKRKRKRRR